MDLNSAITPQNTANTRQEGHTSRGALLHQYIFLPVMGIFGWLLQLKYTSTNASPFVTNYVTMLMLIVAFFVYFGSSTVKLLLHSPNAEMREFISNITFLFGTLASILLLVILVQAFGLFALLLWTIYFVRDVATKMSYRSALCDVFNKVKEKIINGYITYMGETNDVKPQPQPYIVLQIQEAGDVVWRNRREAL